MARQKFYPEETPLVEAVQEPEVLKRLPANTLYDFFGKTLPTGIETLTNLPGIRYTPLNWPSLASQKFTGKRYSEHLPRLRDMIPAMEYPEEFREGAESAQFLSEWLVPVGGVVKLSTSGIKALSNLGKIVNRTPVEEMQFQRLRTIHAKSDKPSITKSVDEVVKKRRPMLDASGNIMRGPPSKRYPKGRIKYTKSEKNKKDLIVVATQENKSTGSITNRYASPQEIDDVVDLRNNGFEIQEIANKLDIRRSLVSDILKFKGMGSGGKMERMAEKNQLMMNVAKYIDDIELPTGTIGVNHPFFKKMAKDLNLKPDTLRTQINSLIKEVHTQNNKKLATEARGLDLPPRIIEKLNRLPISPYMHETLIGQGFSAGTASKITEVNLAVKELMKYSNFEHAFPQGFLKSKVFNPQYELTGLTKESLRKHYLMGERTSNALNTFKIQFDNKIVKLAEKRFQGKISQDEYMKEVNKIRDTVREATGGYEIGYMKFVDGKPVPVSPQKSALEGMNEFGSQTTAIINFFKNIKHNNTLYKNWNKDKTNSIYGTIRTEKFQSYDELAKVYDDIKNFKTQDQFIKYYAKNQDSPFFKALIEINKKEKSFGYNKRRLYEAAAAGALTPGMLSTQLSAEELKAKGGRVGYKEGGSVKPKINPKDYIEYYSDGTKLYKINSFIRDVANQVD